MRMDLGNMRNIPNKKRLDTLDHLLVPMTLSESVIIVSISYYAFHIESFLVIMFVSFEWTETREGGGRDRLRFC